MLRIIFSKKIVILVALCFVLIAGTVYASHQSSYASVSENQYAANGSYMNGGTGTLKGALYTSGGYLDVKAMKQKTLLPDETVRTLKVDKTSTQTLSNFDLNPYDNLFYVRVESNPTSATGWGELTHSH